MIVHRIENTEGWGPYSSGAQNSWRKTAHTYITGQPSPSKDKEIAKIWNGLHYMDYDKLRFGFVSSKQMHKWFTRKELNDIYSMGFSLVIYKVNHAVVSEHQCMFKKAYAELILPR